MQALVDRQVPFYRPRSRLLRKLATECGCCAGWRRAIVAATPLGYRVPAASSRDGLTTILQTAYCTWRGWTRIQRPPRPNARTTAHRAPPPHPSACPAVRCVGTPPPPNGSGPPQWPTRVVRQVIDRDLLKNPRGPQTGHTGERRADLLRNLQENGDYRVIQGLNCSSRSSRPAVRSASRRSSNLPTRTRKLAPAVVTNAG